jgi:hypothetical protein
MQHGCCTDKTCTPQTCMELPEGVRCRQCLLKVQCVDLLGDSYDENHTYCDWFPRRFIPSGAALRDVRVMIECGEETCNPCLLRDKRRIGVAPHQPYCLLFQTRLKRVDKSVGGLHPTLRCVACKRATRK